jgi:hypothetical protein
MENADRGGMMGFCLTVREALKPIGWANHGAPILRSDLQGGKMGAHKNGGLPKQTPEVILDLKPLFWPLAV